MSWRLAAQPQRPATFLATCSSWEKRRFLSVGEARTRIRKRKPRRRNFSSFALTMHHLWRDIPMILATNTTTVQLTTTLTGFIGGWAVETNGVGTRRSWNYGWGSRHRNWGRMPAGWGVTTMPLATVHP
jgi:hypothetical protein